MLVAAVDVRLEVVEVALLVADVAVEEPPDELPLDTANGIWLGAIRLGY